MRRSVFVDVRRCASVQVTTGATFADVRRRSLMSRPVAVKMAVKFEGLRRSVDSNAAHTVRASSSESSCTDRVDRVDDAVGGAFKAVGPHQMTCKSTFCVSASRPRPSFHPPRGTPSGRRPTPARFSPTEAQLGEPLDAT
jgi:hypothetical protein